MSVTTGRDEIPASVLQSVRLLTWLMLVVGTSFSISLVATLQKAAVSEPLFIVAVPSTIAGSLLAISMRNGATQIHAEAFAWIAFATAWALTLVQILFGAPADPPRISAVAVLVGALAMPRNRFIASLLADLTFHVTALQFLDLPALVARFQVIWVVGMNATGAFVWYGTHQERRHRIAAHEQSRGLETEMRDLLESTREGILALDENRNVAFFNPSAADFATRAFGKSPESGRPLEEITSTEFSTAIHGLLDGNDSVTVYTTAEKPARILEVAVAPLVERRGWILTLRDMTAMEGLRTRVHTGESAARRDLLKLISHEISTPLTPALLTTFSLLKKQDWQDTDALETALERIQRDVQRAMSAVQGLVDRAETETGRSDGLLNQPTTR